MNGKGSINTATRKRVLDIANNLNYIPNKAAQALRGAHTKTIGVVINNMHNSFFTEVFRGIEKIADLRDYTYMVCQTHNDITKEQRQLRQLAENGVDGIILLPGTDNSNHIKEIERKYNIPIVLIGNHFENEQFLSVVADNSNGARMAVKHLLTLGDRPIVHIAGPQNQTMCLFRYRAYIEVLFENIPDLKKDEYVFNIPEMAPSQGYNIMEKILEKQRLPLSIFAVNDETALGVLRYCNEHKLKIPEDVAIVGFSDIELLTEMDIPLTTLRIPAEELGQKAATMLISAIVSHTPQNYERVVLPVELIVRESTKKE
jgi:LacI family transcriptional regulator